jgi:hypothetical protein
VSGDSLMYLHRSFQPPEARRNSVVSLIERDTINEVMDWVSINTILDRFLEHSSDEADTGPVSGVFKCLFRVKSIREAIVPHIGGGTVGGNWGFRGRGAIEEGMVLKVKRQGYHYYQRQGNS